MKFGSIMKPLLKNSLLVVMLIIIFSQMTLPQCAEAENMRFYTLDEQVARGYKVQAEAVEIEKNVFRISVAASFPPDNTINDAISSYHIYVNDSVDFNADFIMRIRTTDGFYDIFSVVAEIKENINTMSLVPDWGDGGELDEDAVSNFVEVK